MNSKKRGFVDAFLRLNGLRDTGLGAADLDTLFELLSCRQEIDDRQKYQGLNWEPIMLPDDLTARHAVPTVDLILQEQIGEGNITLAVDLTNRWPGNKAFALCLTHDIDVVQYYQWRERFRALLYRQDRNLLSSMRLLASGLLSLLKSLVASRKEKYDLADWLEVERGFEFRSTFYFVSLERTSSTIYDCFYSFDDTVFFAGKKRSLAQAMVDIQQRGWEIGLHGSLATSGTGEVLLKEKQALEKIIGAPVVSTRQHYLKFDLASTPAIHVSANIATDSSIGSNLKPCYRSGTGLPHFLYDFENERVLPLIEIPLIIQDIALDRFCDGDGDKMVEVCKQHLEEAARLGTAVTFLWHNNYTRDSLLFRVYERMLAIANDLGAWGCTARELEQHCMARMAE